MPSRLPARLLVNNVLSEEACNQWLATGGIGDISRGFANLKSIIENTLDHLVQPLLIQLQQQLPKLSDPDRGLTGRF